MKKKHVPVYLRIADDIGVQILNGSLKRGDKLSSIRVVSAERGVSISTVIKAFVELEKRGMVLSRPKSGFVVNYVQKLPDTPSVTVPGRRMNPDDIEEIIETVYKERKSCKVLFSGGTLPKEMLPVARLNKSMTAAMRDLEDSGTGYDLKGNHRLKELIAGRSVLWGGRIRPSEVITTAGCMEAIAFSMIALCQRGDTIVVESPLYYGILQLAANLGLKVIELPTHPLYGVEIDALKKTVSTQKISLCILVTNFNNPYGCCMPDEHKKEVVKLLEKYGVPLLEDDEYGELHFEDKRPVNCKTFDESGNVIWCGSFSKTLAPGYRVGWLSAGKYSEKIARIKSYHSISGNTLAQEAITHFIEHNRYDHHLRQLRRTLYNNSLQYIRCVSDYFPDNIKVSQPKGGFVMWVEMEKQHNAIDLYQKALRHKISIAPGRMYTLQNQYNNCFRLSYGMVWNDELEEALKTLGHLIKKA